MTLEISKLSNGLTVVSDPMAGLESAAVGIWVNTVINPAGPEKAVGMMSSVYVKDPGSHAWDNDPAMQDSLKKLGVEPLPMTPAQMDDLVVRETAANLEVIKAAGIKQ